MKLHDLRPAPGSHRARTRVGRGIAAGGGKTAGRGTKGQKARAGGSIPPWFEGGQTPLHRRIPKLRGFKNRFKVEYEVVNVGAIAALVESGALEGAAPKGTGTAAPITVNQDILRATGLVRTLDKPLKILGAGDLATALFVVADAFSKTAVTKIEAAGGSVNVLEMPDRKRPALKGVSAEGRSSADSSAPSSAAVGVTEETPKRAAAAAADDEAGGGDAESATAVGPSPEPEPVAQAPAPKAARARRKSAPATDAPSAKTTAVTEPGDPATGAAAGPAGEDEAADVAAGDDDADKAG